MSAMPELAHCETVRLFTEADPGMQRGDGTAFSLPTGLSDVGASWVLISHISHGVRKCQT